MLSSSVSLHGQERAKLAKIGWLFLRPGLDARYGGDMTLQALRDLGYIEGKNIISEVRNADNDIARLPALAHELVKLNVDLIFAASINAAHAAKKATTTIPIVFVSTADPVESGLVSSLARPGANLTGFTTITPMLTGKRFELLKDIIPGLSRVALMFNPRNPGAQQDWKQSQLSAKELKLQLYPMEVRSGDDFEKAFKQVVDVGTRAIAATLDAVINSNQRQIANLAIKNRITVVYPRAEFSDSGGLMSYGPDQMEPYRRMAWMADKILRGVKPADLPVEQPTKFELVINLKTAKQIGLTIPPHVLARADRVIK